MQQKILARFQFKNPYEDPHRGKTVYLSFPGLQQTIQLEIKPSRPPANSPFRRRDSQSFFAPSELAYCGKWVCPVGLNQRSIGPSVAWLPAA